HIYINAPSTIENPVMNKRFIYTLFDNTVISEITKEHNHEKFDVIHSHGWLTSGAFIVKHLNNIKWVHTFHALEKNRLKFMSKEEREYRNVANWIESNINHADSLIAVSNHLKDEVLKNYPVKRDKVVYIPNGVDLEVFKPEGNSQDKKILYVGRFSPEKGIDLVPKIIRKVLEVNKEVKFQIIAPNAEGMAASTVRHKNEFEQLLVEFPGRFLWIQEPVGREELAKLYNECCIFIQPSRYEAFGLTTMEAMACGKAVITSNKGALPEVVENAGKSIPLNSGLFAKEILSLLDDYRLRERYGRRGIEKSKQFSWQSVAERVLENYKKITEKKEKQVTLKSLTQDDSS
ncbi:MAG TPA: glycosyltransferase family 4 protein, partial [Candidatus Nanoarchaeia archaeon]|nr:glycosyltransferase family 4 protein [Candidatus Nanoarchaeia archaeon]